MWCDNSRRSSESSFPELDNATNGRDGLLSENGRNCPWALKYVVHMPYQFMIMLPGVYLFLAILLSAKAISTCPPEIKAEQAGETGTFKSVSRWAIVCLYSR